MKKKFLFWGHFEFLFKRENAINLHETFRETILFAFKSFNFSNERNSTKILKIWTNI